MMGDTPNASLSLSAFPWEPLSENAFFQEGPGILASDFTNAGIPLVRLSGLGGHEVTLKGCNFVDIEKGVRKWGHFRLKRGDIVVSTSATFGRPAVVGAEAEGAIFYTGLIRFWPKVPGLDSGYLKAFLGSELFLRQAEALASGSVIRHFGPSHLRQMRIPLPPLPHQRAIASIVGALNNKIELNRRMNETLEAMARAIFKDWFVDFGPTRAKIGRRAPYLAADLWSLFPDRLDDAGKPEGWKANKVSSLYKVSIGRTPPRKERHYFLPSGRGFTWLSIRDMGAAQVFAFESEEDITPEAVAKFRMPRVNRWSVLLSFKLTVGRVAIAAEDMSTNEAIANLVPLNETDVGPCFTYLFLKLFNYERIGSTSSIATAFNSDSVRDMTVNAHDSSAAVAFEHVVRPYFERLEANGREVRTLSEIRDYLLPKMMSGEIGFRDAEKLVGEAT